jgi:hypothetical protein
MSIKPPTPNLIRWPYEHRGREYELHVTGDGEVYSVDWHEYLSRVSKDSRLLCALQPAPDEFRHPLLLNDGLLSSVLRAYLHCHSEREYEAVSEQISAVHEAQLE